MRGRAPLAALPCFPPDGPVPTGRAGPAPRLIVFSRRSCPWIEPAPGRPSA